MFKPSNITTPRTLADCTFTVGYTSRPAATRMDWQDRLVIWASSIAGFALLVLIAVGAA